MDGDTSLPERPHRRAFTAAYKLAVLTEYDGATEAGARGAILRREGLYSSPITEWRRARDAGVIDGLTGRPRSWATSPEQLELIRLRRRAERAEAELAKARLVIDTQGKRPSSLGRLLAESDEDARQPR